MERLQSTHSETHQDSTVPCPMCKAPMSFAGRPDMTGPVSFFLYRCKDHGLVKVDIDDLPDHRS